MEYLMKEDRADGIVKEEVGHRNSHSLDEIIQRKLLLLAHMLLECGVLPAELIHFCTPAKLATKSPLNKKAGDIGPRTGSTEHVSADLEGRSLSLYAARLINISPALLRRRVDTLFARPAIISGEALRE
ncbi:hypothetical protein EVAR_18716_1 [Eumeta japonica]|uniref:Uncharacterized protein n=1 Tax=Eumeta variegata TaxID=151549 RepID=A0A4C1UM29_EUMVA|nr:hypothetical protein EVAR_18716_1 [Eumeta japonica]